MASKALEHTLHGAWIKAGCSGRQTRAVIVIMTLLEDQTGLAGSRGGVIVISNLLGVVYVNMSLSIYYYYY